MWLNFCYKYKSFQRCRSRSWYSTSRYYYDSDTTLGLKPCKPKVHPRHYPFICSRSALVSENHVLPLSFQPISLPGTSRDCLYGTKFVTFTVSVSIRRPKDSRWGDEKTGEIHFLRKRLTHRRIFNYRKIDIENFILRFLVNDWYQTTIIFNIDIILWIPTYFYLFIVKLLKSYITKRVKWR